MSAEDVSTVRSILEGINRGDIAWVVDQLDPDYELDMSRSRSPDFTGVFHGRDEVRSMFESFLEAWDSFDWLVDEVIEVGDYVLSVSTTRGRGKGSGVEVVAHGAQLWKFRGARPVLGRLFQSKQEALEVAGAA